MTVMTLMTVLCEGFLDGGSHFYFVDSLIPSMKPDKPDIRTTKPHSYAVCEVGIGVGFSGSPH